MCKQCQMNQSGKSHTHTLVSYHSSTILKKKSHHTLSSSLSQNCFIVYLSLFIVINYTHLVPAALFLLLWALWKEIKNSIFDLNTPERIRGGKREALFVGPRCSMKQHVITKGHKQTPFFYCVENW